MLDREQLDEFAERGYIVVPGVVPPKVIEAANAAVDDQMRRHPPEDGHVGPHFVFPETADEPALAALLRDTPAFGLAQELAGGALEFPWQLQIALTYPHYDHKPGRPHIDGSPREAAGRPGTFTMLGGFFLTDQTGEYAGNLFAWPGSHLTHARFFRENGPDAFTAYPDVHLPEPVQVQGRPGDLLLAHYLLGHNIGGNTSDAVRRTIYFRLKVAGHDPTWRDVLQDPWHDFPPLRRGAEAAKPGEADKAGAAE